ncbi:hypothetical protein BDQ12DRAFT_387347 [Crucibulum laeve]|uniref:RING-type domain-containing protein n=1 Tax=Crucibulum laeve TaxID=68775 RepID=A0A5C3MCC5_9AGAR|nr:hypothetical protein BDQ12DRAFT_387347 [Crucibulum laeve]
MPLTCPQCDNRLFSNKEALMQHMKSSSSWHPFCSICDRRFTSNTAYEAHMVAKHPPTFDCNVCSRSYHAQFALEDHYRGSPAHPNCPVCGRGSKDAATNEEHHRAAHPRVPCEPCGGKIFYEEMLGRHYTESSDHPSCPHCAKGCKDEEAIIQHIQDFHPELRCESCALDFDSMDAINDHYLTSLMHPKCPHCRLGFKENDQRTTHIQEVHPSLGDSEGVVSKNIKDVITRSTHLHSPQLQLDTKFASPLRDVMPLFSPAKLLRPGHLVNKTRTVDEAWAACENVQLNPPSPISSIVTFPTTAAPLVKANNTQFGSTTRRRSDSDILLEEAFSPIMEEMAPQRLDCHPRLYLGSARTAAAMTRAMVPYSFSNQHTGTGRDSSLSTSSLYTAWPSYKVQSTTATSESSLSPHSPQVMSPVGLSALPQVSPLASTPLDLCIDIPEAQKPLPTSPSASSFVLTTSADLSIHTPSGSPHKSEIAQDFHESVPEEEGGGHRLPSIDRPVTSASTLLLHCRLCQKAQCEEITATMCGHIFCYRCITKEVINTSSCPVCEAPTLLYCLFKLKLEQ